MPHPSISLVPDDCYPYLSLPVRVRAGAISCVFWTRVRGDLHVPGDTSLTIPPRNPIKYLRKSCLGPLTRIFQAYFMAPVQDWSAQNFVLEVCGQFHPCTSAQT